MNTPSSGTYRWMIFKDAETWFGVALEFNLVVEGDDPRVVEVELQEAVLGYLESAKKLVKGFRKEQVDSILNQTLETEYEERWLNADSATRSTAAMTQTPSPFSAIYKMGIANLAVI